MKKVLEAKQITTQPGYHWFGYYDKFQFDPTDRYMLAMRVDFEHRLPNKDDFVMIGMIDLENNNKWIDLGKSYAFCWQQGCMLQWRPGSDHEIIWNDREGDRFVCRILNIKTNQMRTIPRAIGTISPCGRFALGEDFSRIWNFRPGYAYAGIADPYASESAPAEIGVWHIDLDYGQIKQLFSLADLVKLPNSSKNKEDRHYVNHLAWNPSGNRFLFYHRWSGRGQPTRVYTANNDGGDLRLLSARCASHWTWRDDENVLIWGNDAYCLYKDNGTGEPYETIWEHPNGHQTYIPGTNNEWLLTDTYPNEASSHQELCLFHLPSKQKITLANLESPKDYCGEWRCDLHPRLNRQGNKVVVDSPHNHNGRQIYLFDIKEIVSKSK